MLRNNLCLLLLSVLLLSGCHEKNPNTIVIIHTNDTHSQVEPLRGMGGYEARYLVLDSLRKIYPNLLLFDAGDIFQGTPYFNLFNGRVEIGAYNLMGYDAVTLGNHEFDLGMDTLATRIREADFPVVVSNYNVENTPLKGLIKPYVVFERNGIKVGVIGLGVNLDQMVMAENFKGLIYEDPITVTNNLAKVLRNREKCDLIVVLSHLGFNNDHGGEEVTDSILATRVTNVDMILGGHTHGALGVYEINNPWGKDVLVSQESKSGLKMYEYVVRFE